MAAPPTGRDAGWAPAQLPETFTVRVVGVSFVDRYPDILWDLERLQLLRWVRDGGALTPVPCELRRNPGNEVDPNAVEAWAGTDGSLGMLGHLQANVVRWLAAVLDRGAWYDAELERVEVNPRYPDRPGITLRLRLRSEPTSDEPNATSGGL